MHECKKVSGQTWVRSPALHSEKDGTQKPEIVCLSNITEHLGSTATSKETVPESHTQTDGLVNINQCTPVRQAVFPVKKAIKTISKESENTNRTIIQVFLGLPKNIEDVVRYRRFGCPMSMVTRFGITMTRILGRKT